MLVSSCAMLAYKVLLSYSCARLAYFVRDSLTQLTKEALEDAQTSIYAPLYSFVLSPVASEDRWSKFTINPAEARTSRHGGCKASRHKGRATLT